MLKNVDKILNQAEALLMDEIEKRVVKILTSPKNRAQCFIMAMGMHFFSDGDGETLDDDLSYLKPVMCLFEEYNDTFKLNGAGIRWDVCKVSGKVIRRDDW